MGRPKNEESNKNYLEKWRDLYYKFDRIREDEEFPFDDKLKKILAEDDLEEKIKKLEQLLKEDNKIRKELIKYHESNSIN